MTGKRSTRRTDGTDRLDVDPDWPTPGTPGGWLDPFDDYGHEARAARLRVQQELEQLRRAILAVRNDPDDGTRHIA